MTKRIKAGKSTPTPNFTRPVKGNEKREKDRLRAEIEEEVS